MLQPMRCFTSRFWIWRCRWCLDMSFGTFDTSCSPSNATCCFCASLARRLPDNQPFAPSWACFVWKKLHYRSNIVVFKQGFYQCRSSNHSATFKKNTFDAWACRWTRVVCVDSGRLMTVVNKTVAVISGHEGVFIVALDRWSTHLNNVFTINESTAST